MSPQRADDVLTSDVPNRQAEVSVLDCLHIEAYGGNGHDQLIELQAVQHRGPQ